MCNPYISSSASWGFLCCKSRCGRDPLLKENEPCKLKMNGLKQQYHAGSAPNTVYTLIVVSGVIIFLLIPLSIFGEEYGLTVGIICLLLWFSVVLSMFGQSHLVIDKRNKDLVMSVSACCCYCIPVYRRERIASLSNVGKLYIDSEISCLSTIEISCLYIGLKQSWKDGIKIGGPTKTKSELKRELRRVKAWWKQNYKASGGSFDGQYGGLEETKSTPLLTLNVAQQPKFNPDASTERFMDLVMDIKLQDSENGKLIDMAYELNKDGMIEEYERIENRVGDKHKLIQLLVDKADTIINVYKAKNMMMDDDNKENEHIAIASQHDMEEEEGTAMI